MVGYDIKMDLKEMYLRMRSGFVLQCVNSENACSWIVSGCLNTCPAVCIASGTRCMALLCHYLGRNVTITCMLCTLKISHPKKSCGFGFSM